MRYGCIIEAISFDLLPKYALTSFDLASFIHKIPCSCSLNIFQDNNLVTIESIFFSLHPFVCIVIFTWIIQLQWWLSLNVRLHFFSFSFFSPPQVKWRWHWKKFPLKLLHKSHVHISRCSRLNLRLFLFLLLGSWVELHLILVCTWALLPSAHHHQTW